VTAAGAVAARLAAAGCPDPEADADALRRAAGGDPARLDALVARRAAREPLAYVLGVQRFRGLELRVDPRVLVPRPHTEPLVEAALALPRGARVLDLCTGSGAVALALKHERADLAVTGADLSPDALAVARANAARLGLDVPFVRSDLLADAPGPWDALVANPPYMEERAPQAWSAEMAGHEPGTAFRGGADGLELVRRLVGEVAAAGVPWVALEGGDGQAPAIAALLRDAGLRVRAVRRDFTGAERVVVAER
jgi:release factor glutamine methyltransferase